RERPDEIGYDLDGYQDDEDERRNAGRNEDFEVPQAVPRKSDDGCADEDRERQRQRYDDVACHRESIGNEPEDVAGEDEGEQRQHEREKFAGVMPEHLMRHVVDEFVDALGEGLKPGRNEFARRREENEAHEADRDDRPQARIGQREWAEIDDPVNLELADRIDRTLGGMFRRS